MSGDIHSRFNCHLICTLFDMSCATVSVFHSEALSEWTVLSYIVFPGFWEHRQGGALVMLSSDCIDYTPTLTPLHPTTNRLSFWNRFESLTETLRCPLETVYLTKQLPICCSFAALLGYDKGWLGPCQDNMTESDIRSCSKCPGLPVGQHYEVAMSAHYRKSVHVLRLP